MFIFLSKITHAAARLVRYFCRAADGDDDERLVDDGETARVIFAPPAVRTFMLDYLIASLMRQRPASLLSPHILIFN